MVAAAAKSLQSCPTLWDPIDGSSLSLGFSRQEHWSGLPCPPSGYLPKPVIEPKSPALQADSLPAELPGKMQYLRNKNMIKSRLHFHFSLSGIGEGNGSPLQCSCLKNPRDGGACGLPSLGSHRVGHD